MKVYIAQYWWMSWWTFDAPLLQVASPSGGGAEQPPDILDTLIAVTIILFILSVITEKLVQLIRKYSPFIKPGDRMHNTFMGSFWRHISHKQRDNTRAGDRIEREVLSLSFWVGLIICVLFRVDIFQMFVVKDAASMVGWTVKDWESYTKGCEGWYRIPLLTVSFSLTAFFLTFGSKFFHDLLDTLFQVKNLKRKMGDANTFDAESIEQFDDFLHKTSSEIIQTVIDQNRDVLQNSEAIGPPMRGKMKQNGRLVECIDVHLRGNNRGNLPTSVQGKLGSGKVVTIAVRAIFEVEVPTVVIMQGDKIGNNKTVTFRGTICCRIDQNGKKSLLTCSHILTGGTAANRFGPITPEPATIAGNVDSLFTFAICTDEFDIALVDIETTPFDYKIQPKTARKPLPSDIRQTKVKVVCNSGTKTGTIINDCIFDPFPIKYKDGALHFLSNLLVISDINDADEDNIQYNKVITGGDSGACVYDEGGHPIGMIVATSNKFSFAIPIVSILSRITAQIA